MLKRWQLGSQLIYIVKNKEVIEHYYDLPTRNEAKNKGQRLSVIKTKVNRWLVLSLYLTEYKF